MSICTIEMFDFMLYYKLELITYLNLILVKLNKKIIILITGFEEGYTQRLTQGNISRMRPIDKKILKKYREKHQNCAFLGYF